MTTAYIRFLVIDDDRRQSRRLTEPFAGWGWDVTFIGSDPGSAVARFLAEPFDLVLLDVKAAERDDYAFLRAAREQPNRTDVPVVVTAKPGTSLARLSRCIEHGATDYIAHPEYPVLLRARLQNVLQRKFLQDQAQTALEAFNEIEKIADDLRLVILPIGAALSAEAEYDQLVARILQEAQRICNADAGALFIAQDDGMLHAVHVRVQSLDYTYRETPGGVAAFSPVPLADPDTHEPNYDNLPVFVALTGESVNLTDIHGGRFDLSRLLRFESEQRFRAESCLMVPLRSGQIVGALMLVNSRNPVTAAPVPFDAYHQQVAESLASQAAIVLNNRLLSERQAQLMRYKRELEIGRDIQLSFLPTRIPTPEGWEVVARFDPALEVAGDFFDAFELPHGHIALVIADVVGKGVMAALYMAIIRSLFRGLFQQNYFPSEAVAQPSPAAWAMTPFSFVDRSGLLNAVRLTNAYLITNHSDTYVFATLFAAVLDPGTGRLLYVNAGHNPPLLLRPAAEGGRALKEQLQPTGPAIGLMDSAGYWLAETRLEAGDLLYAYTDGVTEARDPNGEEFGLGRLEALLRSQDGPADATVGLVEAAVRDHAAGAEAFDDVTMLAVRRLPDTGEARHGKGEDE